MVTPSDLVGRWTVDAAHSGRLDLALVTWLPELSRSRLQEWIRDGGVTVDGDLVDRPSTVLDPGAIVELREVVRSRERRGSEEGTGFGVVFEDEHLVVVDKPAGMVTHPSDVVRGGTLAELAVERYGPLPSPQGEERGGIVHRLDAETSGLLILARTDAAAAHLLASFRERRVTKVYSAFVYGEPRFDADVIDAPIGRAPKKHDRMSIVALEEGRAAETFYETQERYGRAAWMRCYPKTGRTHQIRVHLAHIEHPIVGDALYRGRRGLALDLPAGVRAPGRLALHAERLSFQHPATGTTVEFEAPLPADLVAFRDELRATRT
ncbi:MAG: RluA family pseudouridine synthase [Planctomycetota bacterium]